MLLLSAPEGGRCYTFILILMTGVETFVGFFFFKHLYWSILLYNGVLVSDL